MKKIALILSAITLIIATAASCTKTVVIPINTPTPGETQATTGQNTNLPDTTAAPTTTAMSTKTPETTRVPETTNVPATTEVPTPTPVQTSTPTPTPTPIQTPKPTPTPTQSDVDKIPYQDIGDADYILKKTEDGGLDYQNKIIFLGDSTSYGLKPYKMLPDGNDTKQVWYGNSGATIALFEVESVKINAVGFSEPMKITDAVAKYQPEIIVLKLGINGVSTLGKDAFQYYYGWIIDTILSKSPNTKLICQSIYPVATTCGIATINNYKIQTANSWIRELVGEKYSKGFKCYYLETYPLLLDQNGYLDLKYDNGGENGIHLNGSGFNIVLNDIRTHMVP